MARSQIATLLLAGLLLPAIGAADSPAVDLVRGDSRTALVAPGAVHQYAAKLAAGDFLHVIVDQEKIDLVVTAIDPSGQRLLEVDNPYGRDIAESVAFLAEVTGTHTLEIRPYPSAPAAGSYDLIVEAWRPATATDRKRATAEAATNAAHRRAARRTESDRRAAIKGYRAARELWQGLDERAEETRIVRRIGQLLRRVGESDAALGMLQEALALARESSNPAGVAKTLNEIGRVHRQKGANDRAIAAYRDALELWRELGETAQASRVLNNLGAAWMASGDLRQALPYYQQALNLFRQSGDRRRQATALANLGVLHDRLGRIDLAAASYEEALELCAALGRPDLEADVLNNLGVTLDQLGEPYEALESYAAARKIYRKLGDQSRQAAALNSQASLLLDLGRPDEARRLLVSATALLNEAGDPYLETRVLLNSGVVARELDEPSTALDRFSKALDHARRADDRDAEAHALYHQAVIRQRTGEGQLAHDLAQRALALFRRAGDVRGEARALRVAGRSAAILGRTESARRVSHQAIDLAARIADVTEQALGWQELGRLERDAGDPRLALEHFEAALTHFESRRAKISGQALRASHFTAVRATYDLAIDTSMQLHWKHPAAGFDRRGLVLSEQARARGLLDALIRAQVDVDDASTPAASDVDAKNRRDLQARAKNLRRQFNGLAHERRETLSDEASGDPVGDRIDVLMAEYRLLEGRLEPPTDIAVRGPAITPHLFEEIVELLDSDTVLLEVSLAEPSSYLWVLSDGGLESFALPASSEIEATAVRLHQLLGRPVKDRSERLRALRELSHMVLAPAAAHLARHRWVIVPDGALHTVPFAALPVPRRPSKGDAPHKGTMEVPLIAEHEVVHLPSISALRQLRRTERPAPDGRLAVLADAVYSADDPRHRNGAAKASTTVPGEMPDTQTDDLTRLPWSAQEAQAAADEAGEDGVLLALGFEANRTLATDEALGRYRVVHFATHGVLDTRNPELSGLALSRYDATGRTQPSFLRLHDIYPLEWQSELVVLSGCRTALGPTVRGEGVVGLARGFLHTGARQVVASLWSVRDRATAELMRRFYQGLFRQRLTPAAALQQAQRSMWQQHRWRDPYFWAPFILIGDWQATEATP